MENHQFLVILSLENSKGGNFYFAQEFAIFSEYNVLQYDNSMLISL